MTHSSQRSEHSSVSRLRRLDGITFTPLNNAGSQADTIASRLTGMYGTPGGMRVAVESMLDALVFDPLRTDEFEDAFYELGLFLGFNSQRPERELNPGLSDNLWAPEPGRYWVVEAKTGATSQFISKKDAGAPVSRKVLFRQPLLADRCRHPGHGAPLSEAV